MVSEASADIYALANALSRSGHASPQTTMQVIQNASQYLLSEMQARVPVKTGNLRDSLGVRYSGTSVIIGPDANQAPYAGYVEFGTAPHIIRPKRGKYLVFNAGGKKVFARVVHHPGTKAAHYVLDSFDAWSQSLGRLVADANVQVFEQEAS